MNKDIATAKEFIAAAFNNALTVEVAAEMYYDLRRFVTKAFELSVENISDECREVSDVKTLPAKPDCKQCGRFFTCEGDRIAERRMNGTDCEDYIQK